MMQARRSAWVIGVSVVLVVAVAGCVGLPTQSPSTTPSPSATTGPSTTTDAPVSSEFEVGQTVAATWTDGNLYLAKVTAVEGAQVTVQYADDNSTKTIPDSDIKPIVTREWAVGDKVLAVWSAGRFYKGVIAKAGADSCQVKWDDGSAPSDVSTTKIIAQ